MIAEFGDALFHPVLLPTATDLATDHDADHHAQRVPENSETKEREKDRKEASGRRERLHFHEADGGDRDDRHIERIEEAPPLDHDIAHCAERNNSEEDKDQTRQMSLGQRTPFEHQFAPAKVEFP